MPADHPDRALLKWIKQTKSGPSDRSVVDQGVYTHNRPMRMAYCTKRGKDSQLQPILGSSPLVEAHLVNFMPSDVFSPPAVLPLMDLSKLPAFGSSLTNLREGQGSGIGQHVESTRGEDMASEEAPTPRWQPRQLAHLRRLLLDSSTIRSALKVDQLEFGKEETSADGRFYTFNIKRHSDQSYATCPYAGYMHSSNCMCLRYSHSHKEVTVHCYDEDCSFRASGKQRLRWSVILPEDNVRAMAAAFSGPPESGFGSASLHTCEDLVSYGPEDDYCEDKLRPFPDDRLLAIIANMGLGENM